MAIFEYRVQIKEFHIDTMGHVNNAVYLALFEEARWEQLTARGYGVADIQKMQRAPVVLEATVKFLKELRLREHITVTMEPATYAGKVGRVVQRMIKEDGSVACEATFTIGLMDLKLRKLIEPTSEWLHASG